MHTHNEKKLNSMLMRCIPELRRCRSTWSDVAWTGFESGTTTWSLSSMSVRG